jgi:TonB family protein
MLKQPLPGRARTAFGLGLALALIGVGSYAAWAAQPSAAAPAAHAAGTTAASYRRLSRIDYPEKTAVAGECVAVVTLNVDAAGAITDLLEVTVHGSVPQGQCSRWGSQAAAAIMAKPWTFEPAAASGKPVSSKVIVPLVFTAHPNDFFDASPIPAGALDAIRISMPAPDSAASRDAAANEDVAYRKAIPPKYPQAAIAAHQEGEILLKVQVDEHGNPTSAKVFEAKPPEAEAVFAATSIEAVMQWKFNPRIENGKPVAGDVLVPFSYALHEVD